MADGAKNLPSSLQRTGSFTLTAMVVAKGVPSDWKSRTVLLRVVEKNGAETMIVSGGEYAFEELVKLEKWIIYDFQLKGKHVKNSRTNYRYGVRNPFELRLASNYICTKSKLAWRLKYPYKFVDWACFNQLNVSELVDVLGRVVVAPRVAPTAGKLDKAILTIESGDYTQQIELLGDSSRLATSVGDVIACSGLKTKEYQKEKTLETTFLTVLEVNPYGVPQVPSSEGPAKKAMRMSRGDNMTILWVQNTASQMIQSADNNEIPDIMHFFLKVTFRPLKEDFFVNDAPVIGEEGGHKLCWKTILSDDTGELHATVWDKVGFVLFNASAARILEIWEEGVSNATKQKELLNKLNLNLSKAYQVFCTLRIWQKGMGRNIQNEPVVNVNNIESI